MDTERFISATELATENKELLVENRMSLKSLRKLMIASGVATEENGEVFVDRDHASFVIHKIEKQRSCNRYRPPKNLKGS